MYFDKIRCVMNSIIVLFYLMIQFLIQHLQINKIEQNFLKQKMRSNKISPFPNKPVLAQIQCHQNIQQQIIKKQQVPEQIPEYHEGNKENMETMQKKINKTLELILQKVCRICLEGNESIDVYQIGNLTSNKLIKACQCSGSIGWIHQKCLIKWITSQIERNPFQKIYCEICLVQIIYDLQNLSKLDFSYENLVKKIKACQIVSLFFLFLGLIISVMMIFLSEDSANKNRLYILVTVSVIIILGVIIQIVLIIRRCFFIKQKIITKVYSNEQVQMNLSQSRPRLSFLTSSISQNSSLFRF